MIHIETLIRFKESLPDAEIHRGRVLRLRRENKKESPIEWEGHYKEWDTASSYRSPDFPKETPIIFKADYIQDKWQWVFLGEVVL
jgi:hypothetical protein